VTTGKKEGVKKLENEIATLNQMVEEGIEALEELEEFDDRNKFKTWISKYPEIDEKVEDIMRSKN